MFFINPISHWQIILLLSSIQIMTMFLWGWSLRQIICQKYTNHNSLYRLHKYDKYHVRNDYNLSNYPQYALILAKYNSDLTLVSETFYSKFGDIVRFKYDDNGKVDRSSLMISSYILIAFVIPSALMMVGAIMINFVQFVLNTNYEFTTNFSKLAIRYFGISLWSTLVSQFFTIE